MMITRTSPLTFKTTSMELDVTATQIAAWESGEYIQDVFPQLTDSEREFLQTGITDADWDEFMGTGSN